LLCDCSCWMGGNTYSRSETSPWSRSHCTKKPGYQHLERCQALPDCCCPNMRNGFLSHTWCCMRHLYWANCNLTLQPHTVYSYSTQIFALGSVCLLWCCQGRCGSPDGQAQQLRGYTLFMKVYLYSPERGIFEAVPGMPYHLPKQICEAQDVLQQIDRAGTAAFVCFPQRPQHLAEHLQHLARMLLLLLLECCCLLVYMLVGYPFCTHC